MKKIISILLILTIALSIVKNYNIKVEISATGTTYFISSSLGNDNNSGTSTSAPWKTLLKINNHIFQAGDIISLKSGDKWCEGLILNGEGSSSDPITLTSYGTGAKPKIYRNFESRSWCIQVNGGSGWKINNIELYNAEQGIVGDYRNVWQKDYLWIENCYMHDIHMSGIASPQSVSADTEPWGCAILIHAPYCDYQPDGRKISNITIKNCVATRCDGLINTWNNTGEENVNTNITIDGCTATACSWNTVLLARANGSSVKNCVFLGNGIRPISYGGCDIMTALTDTSATPNLLIDNCDIGERYRFPGDPDGEGIDFEVACNNQKVSNSYIHDCPAAAIFWMCNSNYTDSIGNNITNNIFRNTGTQYFGSQLYVGTNNQINVTSGTVSNNRFYNASGTTNWGGSTANISFTNNITGSYAFAARPVSNLIENTYNNSVSVTLYTATSGATIRYTTDGSIPTSSSAVYSGPLTVDYTVCINARAFKTGMETSDTMSRIIEINSEFDYPTVFSDYYAMPEVTDSRWTKNTGTWMIESGEFSQSNQALSNAMATMSDSPFTNNTIRFKLKIVSDNGDSGNWAGVTFRKTNPSDNYTNSGYLLFLRNNGNLQLLKGGAYQTILATYSSGQAPSSLVPIKVVLNGNNIKVYWNEETSPVIDVNDSAFTSGYVDLINYQTHSHYDDIVIQNIDVHRFLDTFAGTDSQWTKNSGTWAIESGEFSQAEQGLGLAMATVAGKMFSDFSMRYNLKIVNNNGDSGTWAGVVLRKTNSSDTYVNSGYLLFLRDNGNLQLLKGGAYQTILATFSTGVTPISGMVGIKVVLKGSNIKVYWNGGYIPIIDVDDSGFSSGYTSLVTGSTHSHFENVVID
ncbi:MAG: chitobiase/beta-hexosaminidase C-terminal domain-containing protein [Saccharofermentanales bacterium]